MSGFSNAVVGGAQKLIRAAIQSPNYQTGVAGWTINKNGTAEFQSATIRGTITGGTFAGADFILNSNGLFFYGAQQISVVQTKIIPNATSGSFTNPVAAGNCVIAILDAHQASNGSVPSTSGATLGGIADHFVKATEAVSSFSSGYQYSSIWIDPNCTGGSKTVAVSGSNLQVSTGDGLILIEVAGLATSPIDVSNSGSGVGTSFTSGPITSTAQNEFWVGSHNTGQTVTSLNSTPWTRLFFDNMFFDGGGYQIVSSTNTDSWGGTQSPSGAWASTILALKGVTGGNSLIASFAPVAGTDQFGNSYLAGITSYLNGTQGLSQVFNAAVGIGTLAQFNAGTQADLIQTVANTAGSVLLTSGKVTGGEVASFLQLDSQTESGVTSGQTHLHAGKCQFGVTENAWWDDNAQLLSTPAIVAAPSGVRETWHTVSPPAGWSGTLRYKLLAQQNMVVIDVQLTNAGTSGNVTLINTLPASYRPANSISLPMFITTTATAWPNTLRFTISNGGVVATSSLPATTTGIGGTLVFATD